MKQRPCRPYLCDHEAVLSDQLQRYLVCQDAGVAVGYVSDCSRRISFLTGSTCSRRMSGLTGSTCSKPGHSSKAPTPITASSR